MYVSYLQVDDAGTPKFVGEVEISDHAPLSTALEAAWRSFTPGQGMGARSNKRKPKVGDLFVISGGNNEDCRGYYRHCPTGFERISPPVCLQTLKHHLGAALHSLEKFGDGEGQRAALRHLKQEIEAFLEQ